jgi:peptide/nickel transport system substrate-binding protein
VNKSIACALAVAVLATTALTSCSGGSGTAREKTIIVGTTDTVSSLDPAKGYGSGDQAVMNAIYQGVMYTPPGATEPVPQIAESCEFTDPVTYACKIRPGQKFANGDPLTAEDVAFSLNRVVKINNPVGGAYLLESLDHAEATNDVDVIFKLKRPNAAWPKILAGPMSFIVPRKVFPPTEILANEKVVGSGAYQLDSFKSGEIASLKPNPNYSGSPVKNDGIIFRYFQTPSALRLAFENNDVDTAIAWRSLTVSDIESLRKNKGVSVIQLPGLDARYLAFNVAAPPVNEKAVRQAIAQLVNRESLAQDVLAGGVKPLYAVTPSGVAGADTQPFKAKYGEPNVAAAKKLLAEAGVATPVALTLWYTPSRWGATAGDEMTEIGRQLDASGLFTVKLSSSEWEQYNGATADSSYELYDAAWYPDYADPDNFLAGLLAGGWTTNYDNPDVKKWMNDEQASTDPAARAKLFGQIEQQAAEDVPVIPLYQANYTVLARDNIGGITESSNALFALDYGQWTKS